MKLNRHSIFIAAAIIAGLIVPALAANTVLFSSKTGDIVFPITPTTMDSMVIGGTTPAAGTFTTLGATTLNATTANAGAANVTGLGTVGSAKVDTGTKTAAATAGAATLNKNAGVITSESLTTAAGATYVLTLTDTSIAAADQLMASVALGTATTGTPTVTTVLPTAGGAVITIQNIHASAALNGTITIAFVNFKN